MKSVSHQIKIKGIQTVFVDIAHGQHFDVVVVVVVVIVAVVFAF